MSTRLSGTTNQTHATRTTTRTRTAPGPTMPPPTAVESLVNALLEAGPEVAEHVVKAAQELLLAAQVVVDAADQAVQEQQTIRAERAASDESGAGDGGAADPDEAEVRHLDLAE